MMGFMVAGRAFLSYVREDKHAAEALQRMLVAAEIPVWRDTEQLWPGEDWQARIRHAITDNTLVFIACFSTNSVSRGKTYQNEELAVAIEQSRQRRQADIWFIPVRFDECDIPDLDLGRGRTLASIQRADLFGDSYDENAKRLVATVLRVLDGHQSRDMDSATQIGAQINVSAAADPTAQDGSPARSAQESVGRKTSPAGESEHSPDRQHEVVRPSQATANRRFLRALGVAVLTIAAAIVAAVTLMRHPHHVALCRASYPVTLEIPSKTGSSVGITTGANCDLDRSRTYLVIEEIPKVSRLTNPHPVYFVKARLHYLMARQAESAQFILKEPVGTWAEFFVISVNNVELLALQQNQVRDHGILQLPNGTRTVSRVSWHMKAWEGP